MDCRVEPGNDDVIDCSRGAYFFAPETSSPRPRMIPKSGHRFSEKIMRNEKAKKVAANPIFVR
jgi:hypothetical protein